jgi:outer membrane murein-binding lipoprotein Lpp
VTGRHGPAFSFWLNYVDSRGGLWEQSGDSVLAVLPDRLSTVHDLPESALITDDPDISREDGVLFLGAGHPAIDQAAGTVVADGDIGTLTLEHRSRPLSTEELLTKIRDQVAVDHGRIDATGAPVVSARSLLRLEVLVSHTVSAEEQFTEVAGCLVDVPSRVVWPERWADQLRSALTVASVASRSAPRRAVDKNPLLKALIAAYQELDTAAAGRGQQLASGADAERTGEIARAGEYYAAALASLDKRGVDADAARRELLAARAEATRAERDRRLTEIDEKYRHRHELRPYRLHLVDVPVLRLATDVRRGERRWPLVFDYLPLLGTFAPTRCPSCDAHAPLVATKAQLGCTTCVPVRVAEPPVAPPPPKPAPTVKSTPRPAPAVTPAPKPLTGKPAQEKPAARRPAAPPSPPPKSATRRPAARQSRPSLQPDAVFDSLGPRPDDGRPFLPGKLEEKKVANFWDYVAVGERRKLVRLIAPESPLAALVRLYGASGPLHGIGVPVGQLPTSFTRGNYDRPVAGERGGTAGELRTRQGEYQYLLLWSPDRLLEEIYPYSSPWHLGRAPGFARTRITQAPRPGQIDLDLVASLLLTRTTARHGLAFTARSLAAWWRLLDAESLLASFGPQVLAAALDRAVRYWSGAPHASYPEAAEAFRTNEDLMRKVTPLLQKRLQLSSARNW